MCVSVCLVECGVRIPRHPVTQMLLHIPRDVKAGRPMHVTSRVHKNIRYLRSRRVVRKIAALAAGAAERGMTILLSQTMDSHVHLVVQVESRKALHDGTRYFRNPRAAGIPVPQRGFDRGLLVSTEAILTDRFLKRFFGTDPDRFLAVLQRMKLERVPYKSLWRDPHPQLALPLG